MRVRFLSRGSAEQISGGYLYNKYVLQHLRDAGVDVTYHATTDDVGALAGTDVLMVDGLALDAEAVRLASTAVTPVLLLHVVPDTDRLERECAALLERLYRRARIVVTGEGTLDSLLDAMGRDVDAVKIEPGVPRHWRAKQRYAERAERLLGVANYLPGKGIARMLEVLASLRDLPWQLTVRGNPDFDRAHFAALQRQVAALGLTERVELGPVPHDLINDAMLRADLLLHFSQHESYSMATAEAIACGLPVLSYRTGNAGIFSRSGLVRYMDDDAPEAAALEALIASSRAYGELRRTDRAQARTWQDVGRDFLDWLEPCRCRRRSP